MKSILLACFILFFCFLSYADKPPCWCSFKIDSENEKYFAWITPIQIDSLDKPWEIDWQITVFMVVKGDSTEQWDSKYAPNGYVEGILSNDGKTFVTVDYWYHPETDIVIMYNENGPFCSVNSSQLSIKDEDLKKTVSHNIWRNNYFFERPNQSSIIIETFDGINRLIKIDDCVITKLK
ncbi:MAG: hypothetical protein HRT58_15425 [Crocinitomicaceae bacterium]|nr:hypothetical protein [Flavobacteriales bacterium]NQZ37059.1 hypothetical protein [Crocinitomicaceae bacterium]